MPANSRKTHQWFFAESVQQLPCHLPVSAPSAVCGKDSLKCRQNNRRLPPVAGKELPPGRFTHPRQERQRAHRASRQLKISIKRGKIAFALHYTKEA
jgi:hypothetical protein